MYFVGRPKFVVSMCEVTFVHHLAITMLLEVSAAGGFILKVYISVIRVSYVIL